MLYTYLENDNIIIKVMISKLNLKSQANLLNASQKSRIVQGLFLSIFHLKNTHFQNCFYAMSAKMKHLRKIENLPWAP